jgi:hypothetical protein
VLIELNLMQSPLAYSIMVVTILIDICLLYIFFSKKAASMRSQATLAPVGPGERIGAPERAPFGRMEVADPFHSFGSLLGIIVGMLGTAMLVYTIWPEIFSAVRLPQ